MKALLWIVILGCTAGIAAVLWAIARREAARRREAEERSAQFLAEAVGNRRAKAKTPDTAARD